MQKPEHHLLVCGSFRATGAQGVCHKKESQQLLQYLTEEANDRGLEGLMISSTGCLKLCDNAPVVIVYPEGKWFKNVNEEVADSILDWLEEGKEVPEEHVLAA